MLQPQFLAQRLLIATGAAAPGRGKNIEMFRGWRRECRVFDGEGEAGTFNRFSDPFVRVDVVEDGRTEMDEQRRWVLHPAVAGAVGHGKR